MPANPTTRNTSGMRACERLPLVTAQVVIGTRPWTITAVQDQDALVDLAGDLEHLPYGFLLWESAVGLATYLFERPEIVAGQRILELGCGVGLLGLVARSLGGIITQTDHQPGVLALARQNAVANRVEGVEQVIADWRDWRLEGQFDVLIGADILYERKMQYHLERIFKHYIAPGGTLLLADPGRPQAVEFVVGLERAGWRIDVQTTTVRLDHEGADAQDVEVAIMSAQFVRAG